MKRVLLTGAAGTLGKAMRRTLAGWAEELVLSDLVEITDLNPGESFKACDLADFDAVKTLVKGCDGIIHLGGQSIEGTFESILNGNLKGTYHIYEAARQHQVTRIFFASSNHVVGFHSRETRLDADSPMRPDSLYGVSKGFGELLARYYFEKFGIESALVRIGSCLPKPLDRRMLSTWLSEEDMADLVKCVFSVNRLACTVVYGASNNPWSWWDNRKANFLGWQPKDSSAQFETEVLSQDPLMDRDHPALLFQGGFFATAGHFEDDD
ncbi:NAD-dependent epimerase/dehydratase family protein [Marinomonas aquiplantarum]|uniref:Uronate dehydrogenase n=1 Tax=Marinomonas aquiplantarum TaxID=491951 RepID=A0A366D492_9GAMM|nr:NAD(P)-dependent oxidoreductase [Marinomonas aquiplantarum]RBO84765.1 uronate dehydrogenase [Marinomonas aquiplantarum]